MNQDVKISLRNISDFVKDFDVSLPQGHKQRRVKLAVLVSKKLQERKLQAMNVYKLAQSNDIQVRKESIVRAFEKLVPTLSAELVREVWPKDTYGTKEEFIGEIQGVQDVKSDNTNNAIAIDKDQLIKKLDEALLGIRVSPSLVFQEADSDRDGKVLIKELEDVLIRLGIKLDKVTLAKIFREIDVDGSGTIEQNEFY
jgi:glutathione synthase/RimK-type ligase-like ATP-grasp enzyme